MAIVAKFYVAEKTQFSYSKEQHTVVLRPVSRGEENREWAAASPSGELRMQINNKAAADGFLLGEEYLITFEHVPKES